MPRYARELNDKNVYHVMLRGNNKENIFIDYEDKAKILTILSEKKSDSTFYIYAYCVMDNHIHLVIKVGEDPLERVIKRIATSYAIYFNKKYSRIGHVFQDRFRSENVDNDRYLLLLIRYVHQNPIKPKIGSISTYKWSSYNDFIKKNNRLVDVEEILGMFSNNSRNAILEFIKYNNEITSESFLDVGLEKVLDEESIDNFIKEYLQSKKITLENLCESAYRHYREDLVIQLLQESNFSIRKIAAKLGLSREMVRRISVSKEPSP